MERFFGQTRLLKGYYEGTHRVCSPEKTFERYWPVAQQIGVTRLADITGLDTVGLPVWVSIRPNSRGLSTSQGKGIDAMTAKVSAMMESIENWHGENILLPLRHDSYASLCERQSVVDIDRLGSYEHAVIKNSTPLIWIKGHDLFQETDVWVPYDAVSTNYCWPDRGGVQRNFVISSNGLASGNDLYEAVFHALAEVIERDAIERHSLALRGGEGRLKVQLESIDDPHCTRLLAMLKAAGLLVGIYAIHTGVGLPTFACTIVEAADHARWRTLPAFNGYGCHVSAGIALSRAITEAIQSRLTHISGSRDDIFSADYRLGGSQDELNLYRQQIQNIEAEVDFGSCPSVDHDSLFDDISFVLKQLRKIGVEQVAVIDLSHEEYQVPVVKVVVPGLRVPGDLIGGGIRQPRPLEPSNAVSLS